ASQPSPVGRLQVGAEIEFAAGHNRTELGVDIVYDGAQLAAGLEVLYPNLHLGGGNPGHHPGHKIAAVFREIDSDNLAGRISLTENLLVGGGVGAHGVIENAAAVFRVVGGIIDAAPVGLDIEPGEAGPRQPVGQQTAGLEVQQPEFQFVSAAATNEVSHQPA